MEVRRLMLESINRGRDRNLYRKSMSLRHIYALDLSDRSLRPVPDLPGTLRVRTPEIDDAEALASLMLDAYAGTIDDENGLMEEAVTEVENYLKGKYGEPLLDFSSTCRDESGRMVSAVLVTRWGKESLPLIAFVMTDPAMKGQGLGRYLLTDGLKRMKEAGEGEVRAVVTDGNAPSERLFAALGFAVIESFRD